MRGKNGIMIAPKHERSTSDVVQLAPQKVSVAMGTFDRSYISSIPITERTLRGKTRDCSPDINQKECIETSI